MTQHISALAELIASPVSGRRDPQSGMRGTAKIIDGALYVQIDGSGHYTPCSTTSALRDGDRVVVSVSDHSALVTGNLTDPGCGEGTVKGIVDGALNGFVITNSNFIEGTIDGSVFSDGSITGSKIDGSTFEKGSISGAAIDGSTFESGTISGSAFKDGSISGSKIEGGSITDAHISEATFGRISGTVLDAVKGDFDNLVAGSFDARYAQIDFSNIGEAAVESLFAKSGIVADLVMSEGRVTGELVGVTIKGDVIEGGTVVAEKLVLKGEDGLYYKLNTSGEAVSSEQTPYNSLSGTIITAQSITAEKVAVDDLVAFAATIGGFSISAESIHSLAKASPDSVIAGTYLGSDGQVSFGDDSNYLRVVKGDDGSWRLAISAERLIMSATGKDVEEAISQAESGLESVANQAADRMDELSSEVDSANAAIGGLSDAVSDALSEAASAAERVSSLIQTVEGWDFRFQEMSEVVSGLDGSMSDELMERLRYIRFVDGNIELGDSANPVKLVIKNDRIAFEQEGAEVAYVSNSRLVITEATVKDSLDLGNFKFVPRKNGNLSFRWAG